jgi:FkbM family methyltransferase
MDIIGLILRITPPFRYKWELQKFWAKTIRDFQRVSVLPCGAEIETDMRVQYERQIWLKDEEWDEIAFLQTQISDGDYFIDVGANIGLWTLTAASCAGQQGHVYSFEPNPETFAKLCGNICRNKMDKSTTLMNKAVSSRQGQLRFKCESAHNISHVVEASEPDAILVESADLDSLLQIVPPGKKISGIKMDTEGHEYDVLLGARKLIERDSPWMIIEFNTHVLPSQTLRDWDVFKHLSQLGYKTYRYSSKQASAVGPEFVEKNYCNILFRHDSELA